MSYIKNMSVVVVGNAGSVLKTFNGKKIDSFDTVIRMGGFKIKGHEENIGKKTTIWSNGGSVFKFKKYLENVESKHIWNMLPPDTDKKYLNLGNNYENNYIQEWVKQKYQVLNCTVDNYKIWYKQLQEKNTIDQLKLKTVYNIVRDLNFEKEISIKPSYNGFIIPSLGTCTLFYALEKYKKITVTGFDFFDTGWYWDTKHKCHISKHNLLLEKIWFYKKINEGVIDRLN